jgi:hypothetical protein
MKRIFTYMGVGALVILAAAAGFVQYERCRADGYNHTQCMVMMDAGRSVVVLGGPK